jgi:putative NIF3 family GTP cyclohydrolase 1 type 2
MKMTIQEAIDRIIASASETIPTSHLPLIKTVDTITLGDPSQIVTGIVSTFMATDEVIDRAISLNANLIISHETIFYNHLDEVDWLENSAVYEAKRRKIEDSNLVIWRFHDHMHRMQPDLILVGLIKELGWEAFSSADYPLYCQIPPIPLQELASYIKAKLRINNLRVVGNLDQMCHGIGILPGFVGKDRHIEVLNLPQVDVVICGELHEWETSEYVRDAVHLGHPKGLIITGHAESEEAGMKWLVPWLQERLPEILIEYIPTGNLFHWL